MSEIRGQSERRHQSGSRVVSASLLRSPDLRSLLERYPKRWSGAAVAAALSLAPEARGSVAGWAEMLDRLDDAIRDIVYGD